MLVLLHAVSVVSRLLLSRHWVSIAVVVSHVPHCLSLEPPELTLIRVRGMIRVSCTMNKKGGSCFIVWWYICTNAFLILSLRLHT